MRPLKNRTVVSKTPQLVPFRDEEEMYFKRIVFDVRVTLRRPDGWDAECDSKEAHARSECTLRKDGDGSTVLSYHAKVEPAGFPTNIFSPVARPFVKRVFSNEMETFIKALEEGYGRQKKFNRPITNSASA